jgi:hypothetical protein
MTEDHKSSKGLETYGDPHVPLHIENRLSSLDPCGAPTLIDYPQLCYLLCTHVRRLFYGIV